MPLNPRLKAAPMQEPSEQDQHERPVFPFTAIVLPRSQTGQLHVTNASSGQQEVEKFEKFAEAGVAPAASLTQISLSKT